MKHDMKDEGKSMTLNEAFKLLNPIIREYMHDLECDRISFINLCDLAWRWEEKRREREREFNQDNPKESDQSDNSIPTTEI